MGIHACSTMVAIAVLTWLAGRHDLRPTTIDTYNSALSRHLIRRSARPQPPRYLEWFGRVVLPGAFDRRHSFTLTPRPDGRTLLQQSETYTGVLAPLAEGVLNRTRAGFLAINQALTRRHARVWTDRHDEPVAPNEPSEGRRG
jgi:hypothetical protein